MSVTFAAMRWRLNGLPKAAGPRSFRKSTAQHGSLFPLPERRFLRAKGHFSIVLKRSGRTHHDHIVRKYQYDFRPRAGQAFWRWNHASPRPLQSRIRQIRSRTTRIALDTFRRAVALGRPAGMGGLGFPARHSRAASKLSFVNWREAAASLGGAVLEGDAPGGSPGPKSDDRRFHDPCWRASTLQSFG